MNWHDLLLAVGAALVGVGLAIVTRSLRPMRFDRDSDVLSVAGRRYALHRRSGAIVAPGKGLAGRTNRAVDEHGLVIANGAEPTPDSSLAVIDRNGASHVLRFQTWRFDVAAGDTVGAIWAIPDGQRSGGYIAYRNATRDETRVSRRLLGGMMRVRRSGLIVLFAGGFVIGLLQDWRWHLPVLIAITVLTAALILQRWRVRRFVREALPVLLAPIDREASAER